MTNEVIRYTDDKITAWFEMFEKKGYMEDTVFVLMADHGHHMSFLLEIIDRPQAAIINFDPVFTFILPQYLRR
jgi:arylsulfatase A-like enzyme